MLIKLVLFEHEIILHRFLLAYYLISATDKWVKKRKKEKKKKEQGDRDDAQEITAFWKYIFINSLVVVENLWDKSPRSNIFSFSKSVYPLVSQKKSLNELLLGKIF